LPTTPKRIKVDRRLATNRIRDLRRELDVIERRKQREVAARSGLMTVSLVGYTNAGKSTLLNTATGADVLTRDALFATLDTRTRRWQLPGWGPVLLSDTIGFVRDLPHHLIESFKATLEEARQADLLLHVADASSPAVFDQIAAAYRVLEEIGIQKKDTLLVLNKIDAMPGRLDRLLNRYPNAIPISALSGEGLERLAAKVSDSLSRGFLDVDVEMGVDNGRLMAYLAAHGEVFSKQYHDTRVIIHCRIPRRFLDPIRKDGVVVRAHVNGPALDTSSGEAASGSF
jgi:GTP-binding protein HflX